MYCLNQIGRDASIENLRKACIEEMEKNFLEYSQFTTHEDDDENTSTQLLIEINNYFEKKTWNTSFCDVLMVVILNALQLKIVIYEQRKRHIIKTILQTEQSKQENEINLHYSKNHYNSIVLR
jgi:pyruvate/2-oxoglutarate dehydrogenase complex dihydrolipoamide acyltransferase (E2) component